VLRKPKNKEYQEAKKAFEVRLWATMKCIQSYSGGTSGATGSKVWLCPYCKIQKTGSVERVRWHLLGMGKNEQKTVCRQVPKT